jgi:hypothetical protein
MLPRILAISALSAGACFSQPTAISLERPAAVGLPVWLKIPVTNTIETTYPFVLDLPGGFGCKGVEVRRNGSMLAGFANLAEQESSTAFLPAPGNPCNSVFRPSTSPAHLPLHLLYRFDQPGVYEVRFTSMRAAPQWTEWTPIEVQPGSPALRASWLAEMAAHAPTDAVALLTEFLPSILGYPDDESLRLLLPYLYHPNQHVRLYAGIALTYWPTIQAEASVKQLLRTTGPSDGMLRYLARGTFEAPPDFDSILDVVLPYLRSDNPVLVGGAVEAASYLTTSKASPERRARAKKELLDDRDHILAVGDSETVLQLNSLLAVLSQLR